MKESFDQILWKEIKKFDERFISECQEKIKPRLKTTLGLTFPLTPDLQLTTNPLIAVRQKSPEEFAAEVKRIALEHQKRPRATPSVLDLVRYHKPAEDFSNNWLTEKGHLVKLKAYKSWYKYSTDAVAEAENEWTAICCGFREFRKEDIEKMKPGYVVSILQKNPEIKHFEGQNKYKERLVNETFMRATEAHKRYESVLEKKKKSWGRKQWWCALWNNAKEAMWQNPWLAGVLGLGIINLLVVLLLAYLRAKQII